MESVMYWAVPLCAVLVDWFVGDPHGWPHPVCALGWYAGRIEYCARRFAGQKFLLAKGALGVVLMAGTAWLIVAGLTALPYVGLILALYFSFAGLALGQLMREGRHVLALLDAGELEDARFALSYLVSRETEQMSEEDVRAGLAETLSENLNDGFVAPFFYLMLGGPALLWAYKAVSTLDSMWGYRTPQYEKFGKVAARMDDVLAWIPARLCALGLLCGAKLLRYETAGEAFGHASIDAGKSASPNAGWPMATAAWLAGAAMGGRAVYFGKVKEKPVLGPAGEPWTDAALRRLMRLIPVGGLAGAVFCGILAAVIRFAVC